MMRPIPVDEKAEKNQDEDTKEIKSTTEVRKRNFNKKLIDLTSSSSHQKTLNRKLARAQSHCAPLVVPLVTLAFIFTGVKTIKELQKTFCEDLQKERTQIMSTLEDRPAALTFFYKS